MLCNISPSLPFLVKRLTIYRLITNFMMNRRNRWLTLLMGLLFLSMHVVARQKMFTVSGSMKDESNGEDFNGAGILVKDSRLGPVTNAHGLYWHILPAGTYVLIYSYLG